ncbi:4853_t:CDS:2, partial [Racocetra persica]
KLDEDDNIDFIKKHIKKRPIIGGYLKTDLPIRTVIYPSYYDDEIDKNKPAILLGSYTWVNDVAKYASYKQEENVELCLKNLKILHKEQDLNRFWEKNNPKKSIYSNLSICCQNEPTAVRAYAIFGPKQFENLMYPMLENNNNGSKIHWAGEHIDIHHAWIVGALNSAVRVVQEVLGSEWDQFKNNNKLLKNWYENATVVPLSSPYRDHAEIKLYHALRE